jgi:glycosyltransferase involved in cell wall biosynthesis
VKLLFLTQTTELGPASRHRVYQFLPALAKAGVQYEVSPAIAGDEYAAYFGGSKLAKLRYLPGNYWRCRRDVRRSCDFDAVFVQKWFLPAAGRLAGRIIYDFDDAVFGSATERILRASTLVFAGNEFLAEYARKFARRVEVVPTVVDTERFRPAERRSQTAAAVVGWIGSRTTMKYLEPVVPALKEYRLKVVSSERPALQCEFEPWSLEREVEQVQSFDIGLAPLADTDWERGKCGLKTLQYMACGIPVIASPVGVQREFVESSNGGLLARSLEEWREKVRWLMQYPIERRAMGERGRRFVEENYSLRAWKLPWVTKVLGVSEAKQFD